MYTLTPRQMAWRLAQDLPAGQQAWLGPGLPQLLQEFLPAPSQPATAAQIAVIEATAVSASGEFQPPAELPASVDSLWVLAPLFNAQGLPLLLETLGSTAAAPLAASRIYSDIALFELREGQVWLRALTEGITLHTLQMELDVELLVSPELTLLQIPAALGGHY